MMRTAGPAAPGTEGLAPGKYVFVRSGWRSGWRPVTEQDMCACCGYYHDETFIEIPEPRDPVAEARKQAEREAQYQRDMERRAEEWRGLPGPLPSFDGTIAEMRAARPNYKLKLADCELDGGMTKAFAKAWDEQYGIRENCTPPQLGPGFNLGETKARILSLLGDLEDTADAIRFELSKT